MSTFNFNSDSITNSASIATSISQAYNPDGKVIVSGTSLSQSGVSRERTLTSRSLSEVMSGDFLFRSGKFAGTFYNKSVGSSLNSLITGGSTAAFTTGETYQVSDPESITQTTKLTGGPAFLKVVGSSILGRKGVSDFVKSGTQSLAQNMSTFNSFDQNFDGKIGGNSETGPAVDDLPASGLSSGSRYIALDSNLSANEKTWLLERANFLKGKGIVGDESYLLGFNFDIDNALAKSDTNRTAIFSSGSYFPGANFSSEVPNEIILQSSQKAYICPAMLELLIYLSTKIHIKGSTGAWRAAKPESQGSNVSAAAPGSFISDHVFGRGFDIGEIGDINKSDVINFHNQGADADVYRRGLEMLLAALNAAPANLIPDSLSIHGTLADEYGFKSGQEDATLPVFTLYPNIKYINFNGDERHRDHVHMSFSGARGGMYTGPNGELGVETGTVTGSIVISSGTNTPGGTSMSTQSSDMSGPTANGDGAEVANISEQSTTSTVAPIITTTSVAGNGFLEYIKRVQEKNPFRIKGSTTSDSTTSTSVVVPATGSYVVPTNIDDEKFKKNYSTDPSARLEAADLYALLRGTILADEVAAIFTGIATREGGLRPGAINLNEGSGDYSIGMFQCNFMLGAHGLKTYNIPISSNRTVVGWQLAYKDWQKDGVYANSKTDQNFTTVIWPKVEALEKSAHITLVDPELFIPINQAYILYTVITGQPWDGNKLGPEPEGGYIFYPWGDHGNGPVFGFIFGVEYKLVKDIYVSGGGDGDYLDDWVLKMFETSGKNSRSAPYAQRWIEGWMFKVKWDGGWTDPQEIPPA